MTSLAKWLCASGLALVVSPFCFMAVAQDYVDLEAERAAREASGQSAGQPAQQPRPAAPSTTDPYGVRPADPYPATSFGVQAAPPAPVGSAPAPIAMDSGAGAGNLVLQVQRLQEEVMRLNGKVEEQANELRVLKEQSLQRYMDLDQRLGGGTPGAAGPGAGGPDASVSGPATSGGSASAAPTGTSTNAPARSGPVAAAQSGEQGAYDAAYANVTGQRFPEAIAAFQQFLKSYPDGKYAGNAHYWLGELYLVSNPPNLEASRQSFALLISQYPEHPKAPDALYKLGKVQFQKGNRDKAREYMDLVVTQYGPSNHAVVQLAKEFIAENY